MSEVERSEEHDRFHREKEARERGEKLSTETRFHFHFLPFKEVQRDPNKSYKTETKGQVGIKRTDRVT